MTAAPPIAVESALARLTPLRDQIAATLGVDAERTWLVGGVVRNALLQRDLPDVDLATSADPEHAARRIADTFGGTAFPLGDEFGCWRIAGDTQQFDICALRGDSLTTDLAARDFTINAMAVPLTGSATIVDEHDGLADLESRRVRMVSASAFDDDPLRMLRAARIAHMLIWDIDESTLDAIRSRAARAVEPAGERTFAELRQLLLMPETRRAWRLLEQLGLDTVLLPELEECRGVEQSRFHHLDVHDHTLAVLDNCEDLLRATDFWLPLPNEPQLHAAPWSDTQRLVVLLAALCHDLGKPATRTMLADGRVSFGGHDDVGMQIVDAIAERWRWSTAMRQQVRQLVGTHLALGYLLHSERALRDRWRLRRRLDPVTPEAIVLSVGDRLATTGPEDRRRWVRAHLELARKVWADHWRELRDGIPAPLLDGTQLAEAAGIAPGPRIGQLVTLLAEAQAVGEVTTRDEALKLVAEHAAHVSA